MKRKISNRNIVLSIYSLLLILVLGSWIWETKKFDEFLSAVVPQEERNDLAYLIYGLKVTNLYSMSVISLVMGIGLFLRNRTGWILVSSWFYYILFYFFKNVIEEDSIRDISTFFQLILVFSIPLGMILSMNKFIGIKEYHGIENNNKLNLNLWAIGIGVLLVIFRILKKNLLQHYL